ncbi:MAG: dehydrogenase subunit, partial [bacterium]|nr:dehydrogenase subunit [bacterium]
MAETKKMVLGIQDVEDLQDSPDEDPLPTEPMTLNMGPSHPAMHGTVRIILTVEGETVKDA